MNALSYLIQVNLYLLLFYFFYVVLLSRETFFKMNRIYLVGSAALSLVIPLIKASWVKSLFITEQVQEFTQTVASNVVAPRVQNIAAVINLNTMDQKALQTDQQPLFTPFEWLSLVYGVIVFLLLLNFIRKLYLVSRLLKDRNKGRAFSFFNKIEVDSDLQGRDIIMNHELVHARQWHSADVIFFELFAAINWFNPITYFYKKSIKNIHEFIADDSAASTLEDRSAYALLLISNVFNTQPQQLTNSFFNQSLLKRRIIMLHKTKSRKVAILKYGLSVPLFAFMTILSSVTIGKAQVVKIANNITVNVDRLLAVSVTPLNQPERTTAPEKPITALYRYFSNTINYPAADREKNLQGTTYVAFEIDAAGKITKPVVFKSISSSSKAEALRTIKDAPSFSPQLKGKYILPLSFLIRDGYTSKTPSLAADLSAFKSYRKLSEILVAIYRNNNTVPNSTIKGLYNYKTVDIMAEFPGGTQRLYEYFKENFKYSRLAKDSGMRGQLIANFIVEKDGTLSDIEITEDPGFETKAEAMRLLQNSPKWTPASVKGFPVRTTFTLPVNLYSPKYITLVPAKAELKKMSNSNKDTVAAYFYPVQGFDRASSASFPGGAEAFNKYLSENLKYPEEAKKNKISGIVTISFAVNKDGSINNIAVSEGIGHGCDEEAIRLIKNSPKWNPGYYADGRPERVGFSLNIMFQPGKD